MSGCDTPEQWTEILSNIDFDVMAQKQHHRNENVELEKEISKKFGVKEIRVEKGLLMMMCDV